MITVTMDRPLGSRHPRNPGMIYPVNYGYIEGTMAPDGAEQDAYVLGMNVPLQSFTGELVAVIHRNDDVEEKWIVVPQGMEFSPEEIMAAVHFQEQYFDASIRMLDTEKGKSLNENSSD